MEMNYFKFIGCKNSVVSVLEEGRQTCNLMTKVPGKAAGWSNGALLM